MNSILFCIIFALFLVASGYIAMRICRMFKYRPRSWRIGVWIAILLLDFSFFLVRYATSVLPLWMGSAIYVVSTTWMPMVLYTTLVMVVLDVFRKLMIVSGYHKPYHTPLIVKTSLIAAIAALFIGHLTATDPVEVKYHVCTDKMPDTATYRIAMVSDIHMGYAIDKEDVQDMVDIINGMDADMVLICGDLIDGDLRPVIEEDMGRPLSGLKAELGTFAVMGNHEYIDNSEEALHYLAGIEKLTMLRDTMVDVGPFRLVGRDDISKQQRTGHARKQIEDYVTDSVWAAQYTIVMDHQPASIDEAKEQNVDLVLSGHTHAGQVWPMRLFTRHLYSLDYGQAYYGVTTAIVTSGYGTWGPRVRLGSQAEVVLIEIRGTQTQKPNVCQTDEANI